MPGVMHRVMLCGRDADHEIVVRQSIANCQRARKIARVADLADRLTAMLMAHGANYEEGIAALSLARFSACRAVIKAKEETE